MKNKVYTLKNANSCLSILEGTKSPFSVYPNERLEETHFNSPATGGFLTEEDKIIMRLLNKLLFSSSLLLKNAIQLGFGIDIEQHHIQRRLKQLAQREYLQSYRFVSNDAFSSGKTYCLGWRGYGFIKSQGLTPYLRQYKDELIKNCEVAQIKKILSAQQYALLNGYNIEKTDYCKTIFVPVKEGQTAKKIFRSQAIIDEDRTIFVEVVRRDGNWKQTFMNKLDRIGSTLQNSKEHNIPLKKENTTLILIAEDCDHMRDIMNLVNSTYLCFPVTIQYTADTLVFNNHEYVYETKQSWLSKLFA